MQSRLLSNDSALPADVVLSPAWWFHNEGISFDEDFFYEPARRVEVERKMEQVLYERWGEYGLGLDRDKDLPVVGPVHLAAGYLVSEMLGCKVEYRQDAPPQVICRQRNDLNISADQAFRSTAYRKFENLLVTLKSKYGYVTGDVNWQGLLNIALDLRGQDLFLDMHDRPKDVHCFLRQIAEVAERFTQWLRKQTGSTSISVNRNVRHLAQPVFLHGECSHTMISVEDYKKFLFAFDQRWSTRYKPFGIHFCGQDPHRYGEVFAQLESLEFLDLGWGGDVAYLREVLPETFLNIRLSPVEMIDQSPAEIANTVHRLVADSGNPDLTGVCCINLDEKVTDDKVTAIFEVVRNMRRNLL